MTHEMFFINSSTASKLSRFDLLSRRSLLFSLGQGLTSLGQGLASLGLQNFPLGSRFVGAFLGM